MDLTDKKIILELMKNCRTTYRSLAKKLGLSSTCTRKRVMKLRESGLISRGYVLLSLAMLNAEHSIAFLSTDGYEKDEELVENIGKNDCVIDIIRSNSHLYVHAEVVGSLGLYEFGKFLRGFECVVDVDIHFMHPVTPSALPNNHKYVYIGQKVPLKRSQFMVLNHLWYDARTPATEIAKRTNYSTSRVQQIIQELQSNNGFYFTIFTNWNAAGVIPFLVCIDYDERKATSKDVVMWIQDRYPLEYWNSWQTASLPRLYYFCTADDVKSIHNITSAVKDTSFAKRVKSDILGPQNHHVGPCHIGLGELVGIKTTNHRVEFYENGVKKFY